MKNLFIFFLLINVCNLSYAQDNGPGGVRDDSSNRFWFIAEDLGLTDGSPVANWNNLGGNTLDATSSGSSPTYNANFSNGFASVQFGANAAFQISDNSDLNTGGPYASRTFSVALQTGADVLPRQVIYEEGAITRGLNMYIFNGELYFGAWNLNDDDGGGSGDAAPWGFSFFQTPISADTFYIITYVLNGNNSSTGTIECYLNGNLVGTISGIGFLYNHNEAAIGNTGSDNQTYSELSSGSSISGDFPFEGDIAEFIMYNSNLNDSERISVENYLSSKYDIALTSNDIHDQDTSGNGDFDFSLVSVNRQAAGDQHLATNQGTGLVSLNTTATLVDGDYFTLGSDLNDQTLQGLITCNPSNQDVTRLQATWRVDKVGSFTPDIRFDLTNITNNVSNVNDISILIDDNAGFSSPTILNATSVNPLEATFSGLSINDNDYITFELAVNRTIVQTPAGLDLEQELRFAFEANSIGQADGTNVSTWTNDGQNVLDATTQSNSPSLSTEFANGQDFVEFDSANNESFVIANNADINEGGEPWEQRSYSLVFHTGGDVVPRQIIYEEGGGTRGVAIYILNSRLYFGAYNQSNDGPGSPWNFTSVVSDPISPNTTYVMTNIFSGNASSTGTLETYLNGESIGTVNNVGFLYDHGANISIGQSGDGNILESGSVGAGSYFDGLLGEFLFYDIALDANQTDLLNNYLMAKYGVTPTLNDIYAYDTNAEGDFDFNLLGVRQTPFFTKNETTYSTGVIKFSNPTTLGSGDAIVAASDLQDQTIFDTLLSDCTTNTADDLRLDATWRVDVQGTPGNIDVELDYNSLQIGGSTELNLDLLIDDNPNFTSPIRISPSEFCSTAIYQNVSFTDGDYFTFERTGIDPVIWDGASWANGSGVSNEPTIDDQFKKLIITGANAVLNQHAACTCLETSVGADLDINGFNIDVTNDITNEGVLTSDASSLTFNGISNQTINSNGFVVQDIILENSNQLTLALNPGELLEISNILRINDGILNTSNALLMLSDGSDTAQIDELIGSNDINGDVIVERFLPARRAFRLFSSSVTTSTTINANWQEGATGYLDDPNPGFGTHITGVEPGPTNATLAQDGNDGFDYSPSGNSSLFSFDDAGQTWNAVGNTDINTLTAGDAYRLMVRGDRSIDVTDNATPPTDTKLRSTGTIVRGPVNVNPSLTASGEVAMIGNPFQSIVDMETVLNTSTNLQQSFVVWDPTLGGTPTPGVPGGRGAFVTVNASTNTSNNASSEMNKFLQPYQAAFVIATGAAPALTFEESDKAVTESQLGVFSIQTSPHYINMRLFDELSYNNNDTSDDGLVIYFSSNSLNAVDANDAPKFFNIDENLARQEGNTFMSIENRAIPQVDEVLTLHTSQYRTSDYMLELEIGDFPNNEVYLFDNYTNTETLLSDNTINVYPFTVDQSIAESVSSNRFDIRFETTTLSTDDFELSGISVYPNPASDIININLGKNSTQLEQIALYDLNGRQVYQSNFENDQSQDSQIDVSQLSSGVYVLEIKTQNNQYNQKVIVE